MNIEGTKKLAGVIELLLESSSRINEAKPQRYWYPLSMATYGVEEILEALDSMCSFRTSMWEKTLLFERKFAAAQGCTDAVMVNSGSSADLLLCFLMTYPNNPRLRPGDEVLAPVVTWPTQIWSVLMAGLQVRLVDIDPATLNMDVADLESKIGPSTRAIFVTHLMGNPCAMDRIMALAKKHNLVVIEDCCEALGAVFDGRKVGNFGIGGSFSFFFSHHLTTMEGGIICCPDTKTAEQLRILRAHGWLRNVDASAYKLSSDVDPRYAFVNWGFNLRPTEIQAGFGLHQLNRMAGFEKQRESIANRFYTFVDQGEFLTRPKVHPKARPCWFALPVVVREGAPFSRNDITSYLEKDGVETRPIVAGNLARHPASKLFPAFQRDQFPGADIIHERGFYIGLSPMQSDANTDRLLQCLETFLKK